MISQDTKERIKNKNDNENKELGIYISFYHGDSDVYGYSEGNEIYINESVNTDDNVERTYNHELLHFFERTDLFEQYKKEVQQREDIEELRNQYKLNYFGIYTEEEIEAGVIDTEITIDKIIEDEKVEEFVTQEKSEIENKRYLVLTMKQNIANMADLSKWEKLFVSNYYGTKSFNSGKVENMPSGQGQERTKKIKEDIQAELQAIYKMAEQPELFKIDVTSKEIIREYESELKALETRGEKQYADTLRAHPEKAKQELAEKFSKQIYEEYKHIVDFIKATEYEDSFKTLMLRETLLKVYKKDGKDEEKNIIEKKRELNTSISGMMVLNKTVLDVIYEHLDEYDKFANLYYAGIAIHNETIAKKSEISLDGVETYGKGSWIKFEGKTSNEQEYLKNAQELSSLVQNTPWCTKQLASSQLEQGDFYVFIDNKGEPHIAVKMSGNEIDEVRGIKNGNEQALEDDYRDVAVSFLENNKDIKYGKEWLESEEWNQKIRNLNKKINDGTFETADVEELNEVMFKDKRFRAHSDENSNKEELKVNLEKASDKIAEYYGCSKEEICVGDIEFFNTDYTVVPFKVIYGNANFSGSQVTDLGNLQSIGGAAWFIDSQITDLGNLQSIGGDVDFSNLQITDLGNLRSIGGYANFSGSEVTDLGNLRSIGGYANFSGSEVTDLGNLQSIGGYAWLTNSQITDLGNLQSIGGNAAFIDSQITDLGNLRSIGGDAAFSYSQVTDLGNLQSIGGYANFRDSQVTDLGNLQSIGGEIYDNEYNLTEQYKCIQEKKSALEKSLSGNELFADTTLDDLKKVGENLAALEQHKTEEGVRDIGDDE